MAFRLARASAVIATLTLSWLLISASAATAAPANDNFSNAQVVGPALPATVPASTIGATAEPLEPSISSNTVESTVWFKWTAPAVNTPMVVDLCGAGFTGEDSPTEMIAVRTGIALNTLVLTAETVGECSVRFNAVANTQYKIQVEYRNYEGNFNFKLRKLAPPANDNFATPTIIPPAVPASVNGTTGDSNWEVGEPADLGGSGNSRSVWFSWTAPSTGQFRLDLCTYTSIVGAANSTTGVYTGNLPAPVAVVPATTNCILDFPATASVNYRIAFSGSFKGEMNFTLKLTSAPPPANDKFANATVVGPGLPVSLPGNNDFATAEIGEPQHNGFGAAQHSVWYKWIPTQNQRVAIRACSKTFSVRLGVYTGLALNALTEVGEAPPWGPYCNVELDATAGTTYWIAAAGGSQDGDYGPFGLDIHTLKVPPNNDFAGAQDLGSKLPLSVTGTVVDATSESFEPSHQWGYGSQTPSVWYSWTATSDNPVIFSACSSTEPTRIAIYSGTLLDDLKQVVQADEGCRDGTLGGRLAIAPEAGRAYKIAVASVERDFGSDFTLTAKGSVSTPPVVNPPGFNLKKAIKKCKKIKSKKKRAACIKKAKKQAAIVKCKKLQNADSRAKCIKKARKRFS